MTVGLARAYFALQAVAGAVWWVGVFSSGDVRRWTLGEWDPAVVAGPDLLFFVAGSAWLALAPRRWVAVVVTVWTLGVTIALTIYGLVAQAAGWGVVIMAAASIGTIVCAATLWFGSLPTDWFFNGPFAFRPAKAASGASHVRRSLTQLVIFWSAFFLVVPAIVVWVEGRLGLSAPFLDAAALTPIAVVVFATGSALGLWSCLTMAVVGEGTPLPADTASKLVIRGPYSFVRNPMAVAGAAQTAAVGLLVGSWIVILLAFVGCLAWDLVIRPVEEADLADRFGDDYEAYCDDVSCWLPSR